MNRVLTSLELMVAFLDRVDRICVYVDNNYYQGNIPAFYLINVDTQEIEQLEIEKKFNRDAMHVYYLNVDKIKLGYPYEIRNSYGLVRSLEPRGIVNDPLFDTYYSYSGNDLGAGYSNDSTTFKVWSPLACRVMLEYVIDKEVHIALMERNNNIYQITIDGDLDGCKYHYHVSHNGKDYQTCIDPYAYSSSENGRYSCVVDINKILKSLPSIKKTAHSDAVIYETSVRDFTSLLDIRNAGTFNGFVRRGLKTKSGTSAGFDYLLELGISHVQLMPIHDFASVDESRRIDLYNWGYDPQQFGVVEGIYSENPNDPYIRIDECISMINACHKEGIQVVIDLVFNHVYDVKSSSFQTLVPYYYFRNDDFGNMSNGSFCSNDINSASYMVRKYLVDMASRWQMIYGVDGFRFDLMGILDVETMKKIEATCCTRDPYFMVYGEGWNMPTMLVESDKAMSDNSDKLKNIGFFNDQYRNVIKGPNHYDYQNIGYFSGNNHLFHEFKKLYVDRQQKLTVNQSINYVACHDNMTLYDYLTYYLKQETIEAKKRVKVINAILLLLPGTVFIHSGQEFCRSKNGHENSYNAGDKVNGICWDCKDENSDQVEWIKELIAYRKKHKVLRIYDEKSITITQSQTMQCIVDLKGDNKQIKIVCNLHGYVTTYPLEGLSIVLSSSIETIIEDEQIMIAPYSVVVLEVAK